MGEQIFDGIEAAMTVYDVEESARHLSGDTWFMKTPEDYYPVLTIYLTYTRGAEAGHATIILQAVHADEL